MDEDTCRGSAQFLNIGNNGESRGEVSGIPTSPIVLYAQSTIHKHQRKEDGHQYKERGNRGLPLNHAAVCHVQKLMRNCNATESKAMRLIVNLSLPHSYICMHVQEGYMYVWLLTGMAWSDGY